MIKGEVTFQGVADAFGLKRTDKETIDALAEALKESYGTSTTIREAIDDIIGIDVIPAMTIHKSKGLEFHTVIFLGLEDAQWWAFASQADEAGLLCCILPRYRTGLFYLF